MSDQHSSNNGRGSEGESFGRSLYSSSRSTSGHSSKRHHANGQHGGHKGQGLEVPKERTKSETYNHMLTPVDRRQGRNGSPHFSSAPRGVVGAIRRNPVIAIAGLAALIVLIVLVLVISSCARGKGDNSSASEAALVQTDATTGAATDAATTEAAATDSSSQTTLEKLTPATSTTKDVGDLYTYATTSFDKYATYNNEGVADPWSPTGYFTTGDSELDTMVKEYCDAHTTEGSCAVDNAYNTYLNLSWIDYVEEDRNQDPWSVDGDWRVTYAKQCFSTNSANCHEFAAAVQYILRYFGYADACAETCVVLRQSGNWGDHSLVFVTNTDGRACIIDTSLSSNGWMLDSTAESYELEISATGEEATTE